MENRRSKKIFIMLFVCLAVISCIFIGNKSDNTNTFSNLKLDSITLHFIVTDKTGRHQTPSLNLKVARTTSEKNKGLMYIKSMPKNTGMIFMYDDEQERTFWMKNTLIPLDMVFISSGLDVVGVIKDAKILSEKSLSVHRPSQYIVELNAGLADELGITNGSKVIFE